MAANDNISSDELNTDSAMDMDFDSEAIVEPAKLMKPSRKRKHEMDIYGVFLIISALFYLIALAATLGELSKYCSNFLWMS